MFNCISEGNNSRGFVIVSELHLLCAVGTKWNVLYTRTLPFKKVQKTYEGVLRLDQKNPYQQKVRVPAVCLIKFYSCLESSVLINSIRNGSLMCHASWRFYVFIIGIYLCQVVLCDNEGKQIDEHFLGGDQEITLGKTFQFQGFSVDVLDIKGDNSPLAEVVVIQDSPANQKKLQGQHPKSSFQGCIQPQTNWC